MVQLLVCLIMLAPYLKVCNFGILLASGSCSWHEGVCFVVEQRSIERCWPACILEMTLFKLSFKSFSLHNVFIFVFLSAHKSMYIYIYIHIKKIYIDCLWNLLLFQEHQWGLVHRNKSLTWPRFVVTYSQLGGCYICYIPAIQRCLLHNCSRSKTSRSHGLSMSGYEFETFWSPWASLGHVKTIALHQKTTGFLQVLVTLYMWRFNFLHILYAMNHSTARAQSIPNLCYWFSIRFLHFVRYWYHHFEVLRTSALRPCSTWRQLRCNSWKTSTLRPGEGLNRWMTEWRWISIWKRRQCTLIILRPI